MLGAPLLSGNWRFKSTLRNPIFPLRQPKMVENESAWLEPCGCQKHARGTQAFSRGRSFGNASLVEALDEKPLSEQFRNGVSIS